MEDLTKRERLAMRILAMMFKLAAPNQEHQFKNEEAIKFVLGEKN